MTLDELRVITSGGRFVKLTKEAREIHATHPAAMFHSIGKLDFGFTSTTSSGRVPVTWSWYEKGREYRTFRSFLLSEVELVTEEDLALWALVKL